MPPPFLFKIVRGIYSLIYFVIFEIFKTKSKKAHIFMILILVLLFILAAIKGHIFCIIITVAFLMAFIGNIIRVAFHKIRNRNHSPGSRFFAGASAITYNDMMKKLKNYKTRLPIGEYRLPIDDEVKHFLIVGRPGTGKTNALSQIINEIGHQKLPAIIHDSKGDFVPKFYRPKNDLILNPFDQRCVGWNIFNDINCETDFNMIACSLIPESISGDSYWYEVPRKILSEILEYCWHNKRTNQGLWQTLSLPINELAELLRKNKATSYNDLIGNEKTASNLMSVILSKCRILYYMQHIDGDFSVGKWVNTPEGFIFLTNRADIKDTVKPILTLFIDICTSRLLSLPDDRNKRIFFILDEFGSLSKMNNIINLLTLSRSKGGAVFIGIQDIGNIERIYGKEHRQTIVNACGNSLTFAVEDPDTAEFLSKKIGDRLYYEEMTSKSTTSQTLLSASSSRTTQEEKRTERLILPSDIQKLQDNFAIVKFADIKVIGGTYFTYIDWPMSSPTFIERAQLLLSTNEQTNIADELKIPVDSINDEENQQKVAIFESV